MLRCCFQSGVHLNWVIKQKMSHTCKQCSVTHRPRNAIQSYFFYFFMKNLGCLCLFVCLTLSLTMRVLVRQRHGSVCQMDTGLERHRINGVGHLSKWPNTNLEALAKFWLNFVFGKKLLMIAQIVDCQIVWKKKDRLARFCLVAANCKLLLDPCLAVEWRKRKTMFWEDKWWRCRVDRSEVGVGTMWVGSMALNRGATMGRTALNRD